MPKQLAKELVKAQEVVGRNLWLTRDDEKEHEFWRGYESCLNQVIGIFTGLVKIQKCEDSNSKNGSSTPGSSKLSKASQKLN